MYWSCRGCTGRAGGVLVVQGVYWSCRGCVGGVHVVQGVCRGCTGRVGSVQVVQGVYWSCRGCTCRAGGVLVV